MRRWAGLALLLFFGFALVGVFPAQWAARQSARREMRALIHARGAQLEGMVALSFHVLDGQVTDDGFQWEEEDEFSYRGALYDVVSKEEHEGIITFHCMADGKEDTVLRKARDLAAATGPDRPSEGPSHLLMKFMCDDYLLPSAEGLKAHRTEVAWSARLVGSTVSSGFQQGCFHPPLG